MRPDLWPEDRQRIEASGLPATLFDSSPTEETVLAKARDLAAHGCVMSAHLLRIAAERDSLRPMGEG